MKPFATTTSLDERTASLLSQLNLKEKVALLSLSSTLRTVNIERLGIPSLSMTDGPNGVRVPEKERWSDPTTAFPTGISMAATWNPALIEQVGSALGEETRATGNDILFGPCVNIIRHPLGGRNFESFSEDPYLAGQIAVAYVRGLQSRRIGASLKHYACNNQETERDRTSSEVDERTLREIYLPAFEITVKQTQPWTVMSAFNLINGEYASQNYHLLTEILKNEWGFQGVVVSDWIANHSTVESIRNGLDLEMPGPRHYGYLLTHALLCRQVNDSVVNDSARRLLRLILLSGKMDAAADLPTGGVNTPAHQSLARQTAVEAITLLKNERGQLPLNLDRIKTIAVLGPNATDTLPGGGGSSAVTPPYCISGLDGLKTKIAGRDIRLEHAPGCRNWQSPPALKADWLTQPDGNGQGLQMEYFTNPNLTGDPVEKRQVNGLGLWSFLGSLPADLSTFSVRWSGQLTVPETGQYQFLIRNTGHARLFLDNQLVLDNRTSEADMVWPAPEITGIIHLTAGQAYALQMEYFQNELSSYYLIELAGALRSGEDARLANAVELARRADVALVFAGMPENFEAEGHDRPDMELPGNQNELIHAVAQANPNTIVVLNIGSPVTMPWLDEVAAVVLAYYPGQEGGHALAQVLCGDVNPSGKLTVTFPRRLADTPAFHNMAYPGARRVRYGEGVFVGYRHYDQVEVEPLFPFGHGLSYTTFEYGPLQIPTATQPDQLIRVAIAVKNTGSKAGQEVVQLYVHDRQASVPRPPQELKGFVKIQLQPGETQTVTFELDTRSFAFYDEFQPGWVVEPGEFELRVGSSSRDIRARATLTWPTVE